VITGFADIAGRLLDNGYVPLPVVAGEKRPAINDWNNVSYENSPDLLESFCSKHPNASTGILLGDVCVIDIDVLDTEVAHGCRSIVTTKLGDAPCRFGKYPKSALFFRVQGASFKKLATKSHTINGDKAQVEIHCDGQQMVVFGTHPDTQNPYYWSDESLLDVPISELPAITEAETKALLKDLNFELASKATQPNTALLPLPAATPMVGPGSALSDTMMSIKDALSYLDPQDYQIWIAVGHALKSDGEQYLEIFQKWSKKRPDGSIPRNFISENDVQNRWETFRPDRTSLAEVFRKAADAGWTGSSPVALRSNSHTEIARYILVNLELNDPRPVYAEGDLWQFRNTNWEKVEDHEQRLWVQALDGLRFSKYGVVRANKSLIDGVLSELHAMCATPGFFNDPPLGLNCLSGFIHFGTNGKFELVPHSPSQQQRFCITATWDPDATTTLSPLTERFFSGIAGGGTGSAEKRKLLEEIIGAACAGLGTKLKAPKSFILHGPSAANGKSQFIHLLRGMLPGTAHSAIAPSEMGKEQFLAELVGKTANFAEELSSSKAIASDKMKTVISGDVVSAKRVYHPVFQFIPRALHIFTTNILPSFHDGVDEGIRRRFVVLPFTEHIPEGKRIPQIAEKILSNEKSAILNLAVSGAARLIARGEFSIPKSVVYETENWFQDADNLNGWLDEGGLDNLLKHQDNITFDYAYRRFREDIQERDPREWVPRFSVFKHAIREHIRKDPQLDIVRRSKGYRIIKRVLV